MKKFLLLALVVFGFMLMPTKTFACGNHLEKHFCKKEISLQTDKKNCCDNDNHLNCKKNNGCGGKCCHSKCACPSIINTPLSAVFEINFKNNLFDFPSEKQKFSNSESFISSGFHSLWLIPKIS